MIRLLFFTALCMSLLLPATAQEPAVYHKARGDYFVRLKQIPEAILQYQKALQMEPDFAECYFHLARIYMDQGQYAIAIANLHHMLRFRNKIVDKTMVLDGYFMLARAWHRSDALQTDPNDQRPGLVKMIGYIEKIIDAFESDPDFKPAKKPRLYTVNRFYYLAKALFIKARYKRDMRQDNEYRDHYEASFLYMKLDLDNYFPNTVFEKPREDFINQLLILKKKQPLMWKRAEPLITNMSYCLYFIWEYNYHKGNYTIAGRYRKWASALNPAVFSIQLDKPYFHIFKKPN